MLVFQRKLYYSETLTWMNLKGLYLYKKQMIEEYTQYKSFHINLENSNTKHMVKYN